MSTLPCKTYRTSFVAVHYILFHTGCGLDIKFSLTVETTVFNSQQLFPSWGIMQERVYDKLKIANVELLGQRIADEWERFDQRIIDGAVKEWRKGLRACAAAEGGQFEHEL